MRISQTELKHLVTGKASPTVVSFGAKWSGSTEILFNIMNDMQSEFNSNIDLCLIDVEESPDVANHWGIREIPTTLIISNDEVVDFFTGLMSRSRIRNKIKNQVNRIR